MSTGIKGRHHTTMFDMERQHHINAYHWTLEARIFIVDVIFAAFILISLVNDCCPRCIEKMIYKPQIHSIGVHCFKTIIKMRKGSQHTKEEPQTTLHGFEVSTMLIIYLLTYITALITLTLFFFFDQFLIYRINYCERDDPQLQCFGYYYNNETERFQYHPTNCSDDETDQELYNFISYRCYKYVYNFSVGVDAALNTLEFGGLIFIITSWLILLMAKLGHKLKLNPYRTTVNVTAYVTNSFDVWSGPETRQELACRVIVLIFQLLVFVMLNVAALAYIWFFPDPDSTLINLILLVGMAVNIPWNGFRKIRKKEASALDLYYTCV